MMIINQDNTDVIKDELEKKNIYVYANTNISSHIFLFYVGVYIEGLFAKFDNKKTVGIYLPATLKFSNNENTPIFNEDIPIVFTETMNFYKSNTITIDEDSYKDINLLSKSTLLKYNTHVLFRSGMTQNGKKIIIIQVDYLPDLIKKSKAFGFICAILTRFVAGKHVKELSDIAKQILEQNSWEDIQKFIQTNSSFNWDDIQQQCMLRLMRQTFTANQMKRQERVQEREKGLRIKLQRISEQYNDVLEELNECLSIKFETTSVDEQVDFLYSFINNCKSIKKVIFKDSYMIYDIVTELTNYNEDIYYTHVTINNLSRYFPLDTELWKKLLDQIFIERKYNINVFKECAIKFDINPLLYVHRGQLPGSYAIIKGIEDLCIEYKYAIPSPHASYLECEGTYHNLFTEALSDNNIIMTINYTIAWTANINWADSAAPRYLYQELTKNTPCLVDVNGNRYVPCDIIKQWKKEQEES